MTPIATSIEQAVASVPAGKFVVAVSGGVDSVVLLSALQQRPDVQIVVAHFDHGMRPESQQDRDFVKQLATSHNLELVSQSVNLGPDASEDQARQSRYNFLRQISNKLQAPIMMAHHYDDLLETAIINMLRGTGRYGLTSLRSTATVCRPLLGCTKKQIIDYALQHKLVWREDPTNNDTAYLRNLVRHKVLTKFSAKNKADLYRIIVRQYEINKKLDTQLAALYHQLCAKNGQHLTVFRYYFIMLPNTVAYELLQYCCQEVLGTRLEQRQAERAVLFIKTGRLSKTFSLTREWQIAIQSNQVIVEPTPDVLS